MGVCLVCVRGQRSGLLGSMRCGNTQFRGHEKLDQDCQIALALYTTHSQAPGTCANQCKRYQLKFHDVTYLLLRMSATEQALCMVCGLLCQAKLLVEIGHSSRKLS